MEDQIIDLISQLEALRERCQQARTVSFPAAIERVQNGGDPIRELNWLSSMLFPEPLPTIEVAIDK